jgi:hypothetical protein
MAEVAREKGVEPGEIEIWFADEARIGQKNKITRRWARRGTRPAAASDQRTASTYIFGAICPALGKGAALVLPRCNTAAMNLHLAEIASAVAPGAHAVLLLDQAGWHLSHRLVIPPNITLVPLPAKCPELNPVENIWQFMRDNTALDHHINRTTRLGVWVLISGRWYKSCHCSRPKSRHADAQERAPEGSGACVRCSAASVRRATPGSAPSPIPPHRR